MKVIDRDLLPERPVADNVIGPGDLSLSTACRAAGTRRRQCRAAAAAASHRDRRLRRGGG